MRNPAIFAGIIYRLKSIHSGSSGEEYSCAVPVDDWNEETHTGDCWITTRQGQVDPGLSSSPVPVRREDIGIPVARWFGGHREPPD